MRLKSYLLVNLCMFTHLLWIYLKNKQKGGLVHKPNGKLNKIESNQPYLLWLFLNPSKDEYITKKLLRKLISLMAYNEPKNRMKWIEKLEQEIPSREIDDQETIQSK